MKTFYSFQQYLVSLLSNKWKAILFIVCLFFCAHAFASVSETYQLYESFPNYADEAPLESNSYSVNEGGESWFPLPMVSENYQVVLTANYSSSSSSQTSSSSSDDQGGNRRSSADDKREDEPRSSASSTSDTDKSQSSEPVHSAAPKYKPTPAKPTLKESAQYAATLLEIRETVPILFENVDGFLLNQCPQIDYKPSTIIVTGYANDYSYSMLFLLAVLHVSYIGLYIELKRKKYIYKNKKNKSRK